MARELSPTLAAQQKYGLITWPYLIAKIRRKWGGVIRYDWVNLYSGSEPPRWHSVAMPDDGSLIRIRFQETAPGPDIFYSRITNPDENSDFSTWSALGIGSIRGLATCAYATNVSQFYIDDDRHVHHRESTDNGANWGSWAQIETTSSISIHKMDAAYKPNGDLCLIWNDGDTLFLLKRVSGSWDTKVSNPNPLANKTGCSVYYHEDWNIIQTYGTPTAASGIATCIYGDGVRQTANTWSSWSYIIQREATEPFYYTQPFARRTDTTRVYVNERFLQAETTDYIWYSHMPPSPHFDEVAWLELVPLEIQTAEGVAFCQHGSYAWLTDAYRVYRALATGDELDITSKLLEIDMRQYPDIRKGSVRVTIDNTNGQYNTFARLGDELTIGLGYKTPAGNEYSLTSSFWITKYRLESPPWYPLRMIFPTGIIGTLVIEAQDAWDFLKRYKTRRTYTWSAGQKSVNELLQFFIARSGLDFEVLSASDAANNFKPEFDVARSTTYRTIIKNLMKMIPDQLIFREAKAILRNPTIAEAVDWTYHNTIGTALLLFRGRYGTSAWDPNRAEVWGDTFMKMAANWPQIAKVRDRLSRVTTPTYPDLSRASERADAELRRAEILTGEESWLNAPTNCGLEPWDKLKITDTTAGVANIYRRVLRIKTYWNARQWQYQQIITLGAD